jgi:hypothetical protein
MLTNPGVMETIDTGFLVQTGQIIPVRLWKQAYARKALLSRSVRRSMRSWEREDRAERLRRRAEQDYVHGGGKYGGGGRGAFGDFGSSAAARRLARRGNDVATSSAGQLSAQASSSAAEAALASSGCSAAGQAEARIMDQQQARQAAAAQAQADEAAAADAEWSASDLAPLAKLDRLVGAARAREAEVLEHPERATAADANARPGLAALGISVRSFLPPSSSASAEDGAGGTRSGGGGSGGGGGDATGSGRSIVQSLAAKREWVALYTGSKRTAHQQEQEAAARAGGGAPAHESAIAKTNKRNIRYHGKHNDAAAQAAFLESFCGTSSKAQRRTRYDAKVETDAIIAQTQERIALLFAHPPKSAFMDIEPGEKRTIL